MKGSVVQKKETWFNRDELVSASLRSHQTWLRSTKRDLQKDVASAQKAMDDVGIDVRGDVKNEMRLCKNRVYALKLVIGEQIEGSVEVGDSGLTPEKVASTILH